LVGGVNRHHGLFGGAETADVDPFACVVAASAVHLRRSDFFAAHPKP
jgi:hypothetical protein